MSQCLYEYGRSTRTAKKQEVYPGNDWYLLEEEMTLDFSENNKVQSIINTGKLVKLQQEWSENFERAKLQAILDAYHRAEKITIRRKFDKSQELPVEKSISFGHGFEYVTGQIKFSREELVEKVKALPLGQSLELKLIDVEFVQLFPDLFFRESKRLAKILAQKFNVNAVYLFGSLAWGEIVTPDTDIDLAVSGLGPENLYKAIGYLKRETQFFFDLILLDDAPSPLQKRILKEGMLLYESELIAVGG